MRALKPRQRKILVALTDLGGQASTRQIAEKVGLNTNGVSQTLSTLDGDYVHLVKYDHADSIWQLIKER